MGMIKKKKPTVPNVGNIVEQLQLLQLTCGNVKSYGSFENLAIKSIFIKLAILFLCIYLGEMKTFVHTKSCE